jgi:ABC-type dipeptide/oligopeptide/nickel transport system ATPase subunit
MTARDIKIEVRDLTMAYGSFVLMRGVNARVRRGEVFIIMGGSGCGKSTLLKHLIGLKAPAQGDVLYDGRSFWHSSEAESLVTGLLYVDLSILSDPPPATYHQVQPIYQEIPSAPNDIQMVMENLARLDIKGLSERLDRVLLSIDQTLGELQMREINAGLTNLLGSLNQVVGAPHLTNALASLDRTLAETRQLAERLQTRVDPLAAGAEQTLADARQTMSDLRLAIEDLRDLLAPEAPLKRELAQALEQISVAARSIGDLADYLSRNPNALLSGRKPPAPAP